MTAFLDYNRHSARACGGKDGADGEVDAVLLQLSAEQLYTRPTVEAVSARSRVAAGHTHLVQGLLHNTTLVHELRCDHLHHLYASRVENRISNIPWLPPDERVFQTSSNAFSKKPLLCCKNKKMTQKKNTIRRVTLPRSLVVISELICLRLPRWECFCHITSHLLDTTCT